jgi:chemotaxis methyl-accepting protein methylase
LVERETGIVIRDPQLPGLKAMLARLEPDMDVATFLSEAADPAAGSGLLGRLVDEVTIQETYFLRERSGLDAIDWAGLLTRVRATGSQSVRIWVAACATGEEAYSLAMLASEALGPAGTKVTVLGTDISTAALRRAEQGRYSERSMQNVAPELRERYFVRDGRHHRVGERLRTLVRLRLHNLISDPAPPLGELPFDLITCRNVLIYFDPPTVEGVIGGLETALRPQGQLLLGVADRLIGTSQRLTRLAERRKTGGRRPSPPRPATLRRPLRRAAVTEAPASDPLDAEGYFLRGLTELERGEANTAAATLRRALYLDPSFGLAAFQLGRAQDATGDRRAGRRAYEQALRILDPDDKRHREILDQVDLEDVAEACRVRLRGE